ncbi:hypothetical protein BRADI_5g01827v3 [Brachypodium distachyon]|uniref:Uncharacterized protein n=2 Tax=Brachypodium distachyon TaxID=15368 RepID=A0A2K2CEY1_BRADI|nr:hypothetical protein BRADI_5g01827v3 [Brachypodium distachyon]
MRGPRGRLAGSNLGSADCLGLMLEVIRVSIIDAHMMDLIAHYNALEAIHHIWEDDAIGNILRDLVALRSLTVQAQQSALKIFTCLPSLPNHVNDIRCVMGFIPLLISLHTDVVRVYADALLLLSPFVPCFSCAMANSYCITHTHTTSAN